MTYYIWPFPASITIGQHFRDLPNNGVNPAGGHTGDDFPCSEGTPVRAPGNGRVVKAGTFALMNGADNQWWYTPMGGNTIVLDCGDTEPTFGFSHLSSFAVNEGDWVAQGQVIGYTGNTGTSTGPHCHFEAIPPGYDLHSDTYGRVDPATYCTGYFDGSAAIAAQGTITPQEDLVPNANDPVFKDVNNQPCSLQDYLLSLDLQLKSLGVLTAIDGSTVTVADQLRSLDNKVTNLPAAVLNAQFKLPDGTVTNLAGILTAINAKPVTGGSTNIVVPADPQSVVHALAVQLAKV